MANRKSNASMGSVADDSMSNKDGMSVEVSTILLYSHFFLTKIMIGFKPTADYDSKAC